MHIYMYVYMFNMYNVVCVCVCVCVRVCVRVCWWVDVGVNCVVGVYGCGWVFTSIVRKLKLFGSNQFYILCTVNGHFPSSIELKYPV